jgi:hypothetical protein
MNIPLFVPDLDLLTEWEATEVRRLFAVTDSDILGFSRSIFCQSACIGSTFLQQAKLLVTVTRQMI